MKNLLLSLSFAILSLFAVACKKSPDVVAPVATNPIAGEYKATAVTTFTVDGTTKTESVTGTLSVYVGNAPNTYYFIEKYPAYQQSYMTTHTGNSFTLEQIEDVIFYNNIEWKAYQNGTGKTASNQISMSKGTDGANATIRTPNGNSYLAKPIQKRVTLVAVKQ